MQHVTHASSLCHLLRVTETVINLLTKCSSSSLLLQVTFIIECVRYSLTWEKENHLFLFLLHSHNYCFTRCSSLLGAPSTQDAHSRQLETSRHRFDPIHRWNRCTFINSFLLFSLSALFSTDQPETNQSCDCKLEFECESEVKKTQKSAEKTFTFQRKFTLDCTPRVKCVSVNEAVRRRDTLRWEICVHLAHAVN